MVFGLGPVGYGAFTDSKLIFTEFGSLGISNFVENAEEFGGVRLGSCKITNQSPDQYSTSTSNYINSFLLPFYLASHKRKTNVRLRLI